MEAYINAPVIWVSKVRSDIQGYTFQGCCYPGGMELNLAPDTDPLAPEETKNLMCPCAGLQSVNAICMSESGLWVLPVQEL